MADRIVSLDYLRGLAACTVMIGHYHGWVFGPLPVLLHKAVTFSVSIFYILSGMALYSVYQSKFKFNFESFSSFIVKRTFRILPLLWIATTAAVVINHHYNMPWRVYFYNYSGLFGFTTARYGLAHPAWSVGNEVVFYFVFPFIILISTAGRKYLVATFLISLAIAFYFTFFEMRGMIDMTEAFYYYTHPMNQLFLFVGGMLIAHLFNGKYIRYSILILVLLVIAFVVTPINDRIEMVTGVQRFILCGICFMICLLLLTTKISINTLAHRPLKFLGDASYSIYLLHSPVYFLLSKLTTNGYLIDPLVIFLTCVSITLILSYIVYTIVEKPAMNLSAYFSTTMNLAFKSR
jgi:exopolysaccharide production protein ExoZ